VVVPVKTSVDPILGSVVMVILVVVPKVVVVAAVATVLMVVLTIVVIKPAPVDDVTPEVLITEAALVLGFKVL